MRTKFLNPLDLPVGKWMIYYVAPKGSSLWIEWRDEKFGVKRDDRLEKLQKTYFGLHLRGCVTLAQRRNDVSGEMEYLVFAYKYVTERDVQAGLILAEHYDAQDPTSLKLSNPDLQKKLAALEKKVALISAKTPQKKISHVRSTRR